MSTNRNESTSTNISEVGSFNLSLVLLYRQPAQNLRICFIKRVRHRTFFTGLLLSRMNVIFDHYLGRFILHSSHFYFMLLCAIYWIIKLLNYKITELQIYWITKWPIKALQVMTLKLLTTILIKYKVFENISYRFCEEYLKFWHKISNFRKKYKTPRDKAS